MGAVGSFKVHCVAVLHLVGMSHCSTSLSSAASNTVFTYWLFFYTYIFVLLMLFVKIVVLPLFYDCSALHVYVYLYFSFFMYIVYSLVLFNSYWYIIAIACSQITVRINGGVSDEGQDSPIGRMHVRSTALLSCVCACVW